VKSPPEQKAKAILWLAAFIGLFLLAFYATGKFTYIPDGTAGYYYMLAFAAAGASVAALAWVIFLLVKR